ncbi:MAG: IPT/TIG domain-containing protein, partial [Burkholderiales bacterium]|nr:IPT/TIG domain-containing protein [Burkholderiales bacterium]
MTPTATVTQAVSKAARNLFLFAIVLTGISGPSAEQDGSISILPAAYGAQTTQYSYDALGRLISTTDAEGVTTDYVYDKAGNLKSVTRRALPVPSIDSLTPSSGQVGQAVTIRGTNFKAVAAENTIRFAGVAAVVSSATTTTLQTSVPTGAISGPVTVTTSAGLATSPSPFTVLPSQPPQITGISPTVVAPGGAFTVAGSNFVPATSGNQVTVNAATATVTAATDLNLTVAAPIASGGKVKVTTQAGNATSTSDLFIVPAPNVAADVVATGRVSVNGAGQTLPLAASKIGLLLFEGTAGLTGLKARLTNITLQTGTVALFKPNGQQLGSTQSFNAGTSSISLPVLEDTGTHTLRVIAGVAGGNVTVSLGEDIEGPITLDAAPTSLAFAASGQSARLTFTGSAGAQLVLDVTDVSLTGNGATINLRQPNGSLLYSGSVGATGLFARLPLLPVNGEYVLEIIPFSGGSGSLKVALATVVDQDFGPIAVGETKAVATTARGQLAILSFVGAVGDRLGLNFTTVTFAGGGTVSVRRPDGSLLSTGTIPAAAGAVAIPDLSVAGNYRVEISGINGNPGAASVTLYRSGTIDAGLLLLGQEKTVTFDFPGQQATLTFSGAVGQQLGLTISGSTLTNGGSYSITAPNGATF